MKNKLSANIKGVIFDLDGTLLDTIADIADSMNKVLGEHGYPLHNILDYKNFVGDGLYEFVKRALPEANRHHESVSSCVDVMRHIYSTNCASQTKPYPGIVELLEELVKRKIKLAVLSNKIDEATKVMVAHHFPQIAFDIVLGARSNVELKPDSAAAIEISHKLQLRPEEIVFVGDSDVDMQTAVNAGNCPVGVLWGYQTAEVLEANGAEVLLNKPSDLLLLFG